MDHLTWAVSCLRVSGLFPQTLEVLLKVLMLLSPLRKMNFSAKVLEASLAKEASLETPKGYYLGQLFICFIWTLFLWTLLLYFLLEEGGQSDVGNFFLSPWARRQWPLQSGDYLSLRDIWLLVLHYPSLSRDNIWGNISRSSCLRQPTSWETTWHASQISY